MTHRENVRNCFVMASIAFTCHLLAGVDGVFVAIFSPVLYGITMELTDLKDEPK